jgi:hypothetical protein
MPDIRPTPTQDENDRFALGEHILTRQDDGSGPPIDTWPPITEPSSPALPDEGGDGGDGEPPTEPEAEIDPVAKPPPVPESHTASEPRRRRR